MSCFQGQMDEYRHVALDRFDGKNLKCTAFFLSHCHKDHMVGLNSSAFHEKLKSRDDVKLYCTEISRLLLLADNEYRHLEKFIVVLDVGESRHIRIPGSGDNKKDTYVSITPISAGHCLGSVMFLFEGGEGTALYTGDFRWEVEQASRISAFWYQGSIKNIQSMYVDTTFCVPEAFHIPSRNECVEAAYHLISSCLDKDLCNAVSISCPARYGHEHFLLELAKRLNTKIHVPSWKVDVYDNVPELKGYFVDDASKAKIHSCATRAGFTKTYVLPCGYKLPNRERLKLLNIRPSTMWFTSSKTKSNVGDLVVSPATHRGLHRVCYSMHSSYSEIRDLVSFIKPQKVFPNVLPASDKDMTTVQKRLDSFINHPNKFRLQPASNSNNDHHELKPLGTLRQMTRKVTMYSRAESFESGSDDLVFSSQELSPSKSSSSFHHGIKSSVAANADVSSSPCEKSPSSKVVTKSPNHPISSLSHQDASLEFHSSYSGSSTGRGEGEIDLFSNEDNEEETDKKLQEDRKVADPRVDDVAEEILKTGEVDGGDVIKEVESLRSYISGESDVEDEDDGERPTECDKAPVISVIIGCDKKDTTSPCSGSLSKNNQHERNAIDSCLANEDYRGRIVGVDIQEKSDLDLFGGENKKCSSDTEEEHGDHVDLNLQTKSAVEQFVNSENIESDDKKLGQIVGDCDESCDMELNPGKDVKDDMKHKVQISDDEDSDDCDIIPNSQETVTNVKSGFLTCTQGKKSQFNLQKQRDELKESQRPDVPFKKRRDNFVVENEYCNDDVQKFRNVCGEKNESYCSLSDDSESGDDECEIICEEKPNSEVLVLSGNDDFTIIDEKSKDDIIASNYLLGLRGTEKSGMSSVFSGGKNSQPHVIDVEENRSSEQDSDELVEFLCEESESTSSSQGWLSKKRKKGHEVPKFDSSHVTVTEEENLSLRTCESKRLAKKRKDADGSQGKSWNSKMKKRSSCSSQGKNENVGDFDGSFLKGEQKESVVDLTLDDSL